MISPDGPADVLSVWDVLDIFGVFGILGVLFVSGMLLFSLLLFYGVMMSRRLMFHARPFPDRESQEALLAGAKVLQNVSLPILFTSDRVKSPTVWCWGLHPAVLLPEELTAQMPAEERDAVFLHELAHITRRDHLTALFCRLSGVLLFWHPLYWLALWLSDLLADEACDLLVLSRGTVSPGNYSETLLKLAAGEKYKPAFQFLSRKEKIMRRINTIFDFADRPNLATSGSSRLWTGTVVLLALLFCVGLAFCQEVKQEQELWKTPDEMGYTHLALFEPAGDFDPKAPQELLDKLNETLSKRKDIPTGYFRTGQDKELKLVGRICTNNPEGLKEVIEPIPDLKLVRIGALTEAIFERHTGQKVIKRDPSAWHTPDEVGHTHLAIFKPAEGFGPKTPQELLNKLNETLLKRGNIVTGYFRTGQDGEKKLVGRICTNGPEGLKEVIESIPELKLVEIGALTEAIFEKHTGQKLAKAPVIVKLEPANDATDVDAAAVKELRVTFDRDMNTGGSSWTGGGESFPETPGKPKWIDKRTCVLPVKLQPGKSYTLGINSKNFKNFKSKDSTPVEPVVYTFSTK